MRLELEAQVVGALFEPDGEAMFALGDGRVAWAGGAAAQAHEGPVLAAVRHPTADGVITGGDDGRLLWSRRDGSAGLLAEVPGRWIESVAAEPGASLVAFAAGREVRVIDLANPSFTRLFPHERTAAAVAFDARARRLAVATYGGVVLWWSRIEGQQPVMLKWAGSHVVVVFSPDGRFVVSSMQESALHGWRLADARDMRMGGYPTKVRSLAFLDRGRLLATSGANGAVVWPFAGADGPMGKQAMEIGFDEQVLVTRIATDREGPVMAAGLSDGRVWAAHVASGRQAVLKAETGPPVSALALAGRRVAWGDEGGAAGVAMFDESLS